MSSHNSTGVASVRGREEEEEVWPVWVGGVGEIVETKELRGNCCREQSVISEETFLLHPICRQAKATRSVAEQAALILCWLSINRLERELNIFGLRLLDLRVSSVPSL